MVFTSVTRMGFFIFVNCNKREEKALMEKKTNHSWEMIRINVMDNR